MELDRLGKLIFLYLLSCPYGNIIGFYKVSPKKVAQDLAEDEEAVCKAMCGQTKLWLFDRKANQVLVPSYLKYNAVNSISQITSAIAQLKQLSVGMLHKDFIYAAFRYANSDLIKAIPQEIKRQVYLLIEPQTDNKSALVRSLLEPYV